ncbi:hypothetical protein AB0M36_37195 [Actinoplanes sp. NPDC051346]|uniref:hypothetical protein n=1 Tax=Actinoplanes sp. NPDC051346 TaxID=3155048 RepID=UPI00341483E1
MPVIWLTPVLTDGSVVEAITANPAPQLLVGGTGARFGVPRAALATGRQVLEIPEADHSLRVPGSVRRYTGVLGLVEYAQVCLEEINRPARDPHDLAAAHQRLLAAEHRAVAAVATWGTR